MRNFFILIFFNNYSKNLLIFKKLIFLKIYIFQDVCFLNNNNNIFFFEKWCIFSQIIKLY